MPHKSSDPHRHVCRTARATCVGLGINQTARDAKVTKLDVAALIKQNVARLYISVYDAVVFFQVMKGLHSLYRNEKY